MSKKAKKTEKQEEKQEEKKVVRTMSQTLQNYRAKYQPTVSHTGRKSLSVGDELAKALEGKEPQEVVAIAERALGLKKGELWAKYQKLNAGQQRMNAGNRMRAAVKRGDLSSKQIQAAIH